MDAMTISDLTRRRLAEVAARIATADALLVTAGPGMGVDSGPTVDGFPAPHAGFRLLLGWAKIMPAGYFVVASNLDRQFQAAGFPITHLLEPYGRRSPALDLRYTDWLISVRGKRIVVLECGIGAKLTTIRRAGERVAERSTATLVRINPAASEHDASATVLKLPALAALTLLDQALPEDFHQRAAATVPELDPMPPLRAFKKPVTLNIAPVTEVDLGRGLVALFEQGGIQNEYMSRCMDAFALAQLDCVPIPTAAGQAPAGYEFTARAVYDSDTHRRQRRPGAAIIFVLGPDDGAIMTVGVARSPPTGRFLWRLLHETSRTRLMALDYPRESWIARRPDPQAAESAEMWPVLIEFTRTLACAWLTYHAFLDILRETPEEE
jgi:hypothetical protein